MPAIRDTSFAYESTTTDAGLTIPMCAYGAGDLLLAFCAGDTGAPTWGCSNGVGTFGGATVTLQGSLDGTNWATLTDAQGNAISVTSAALEAVTELVRYIRPVVTGGSGTDVTVLLLMRVTY